MTDKLKAIQKYIALLTLFALCFCFILPNRASGVIYFTAVNDNLLPLDENTIPFWSGGVLYAPWSTFDEAHNGVGTELYGAYSKNSSTVTLYNLQNMLVFDLDEGNSHDHHSQEIYTSKAIMQNGVPFLPVSMVCTFFDLNYGLHPTDYGTLIRITNDKAVLDNSAFLDAAAPLMSTRLAEYEQSNNPDPSIPAPDPTPTPLPILPSNQSSVFLAVRYEGDTSGTEDILLALSAQGAQAIFFFPPDSILEEGDLIRRLMGSGHSIGILAEGNTLSESRILLERGNEALVQVSRTRTTLALCPDNQQEDLENEGWVTWQETENLVPNAQGDFFPLARSMIQSLSTKKKSTYLTLDTRSDVGKDMSSLIELLEDNQFILTTPLETRL